ncbi:MAG: DNA primase [Clostridia bacterium]|nr:DNA primase [Clostridia bacterium]
MYRLVDYFRELKILLTNFGLPADFIEEVKRRNDIISVISKSLSLEKKGRTHWACCPFHFEKTPSFAVNEVEQFYHCFGCGESGDVIKFVEKYENMTFFEAVKFLAQNAGMSLPEINVKNADLEALKQKEKVLKALSLARDYYISKLDLTQNTPATAYVLKRGLTDEVVKYFGIGYSPDWNGLIRHLEREKISLETMKLAGLIEHNEHGNPYDVFATRLMFPILNSFGDCIGFTARTLDDSSKFAKYRNSTQTIVFDKSKTIYNIHTIKNLKKEQNIDYIIICEGTIDVIAMFKAGFKNTVACLGTALTPYHASELKRYTSKIILCLDGDNAGQNATYKAIDVLSETGLEVRVVKLKDNLDPDEFLKKYGAEDLKEALSVAKDSIEYKLDTLSIKNDLKDNYQKNTFITQALEVLKNLNSNSEKEIYLKIVAEKTDVPIDILRRDLQKDRVDNPHQNDGEMNEEKDFITRPQGEHKAVQFVLASIIHKQEYAFPALSKKLIFQNPNYQKLFDFAKECHLEGKTYTISSLFDYFEVEKNEDISRIINFNFSSFNENKKVYFDECLGKITLLDLKAKQEQLMKSFKEETDNAKRRQIAEKLTEIAKEIKNGDK